MSIVRDFEFFTLAEKTIDNLIPITSTPTIIAELEIDEVVAGDLIWLNGVVGGLDNDNERTFATFDIRIFKDNVLVPGNEIYFMRQEVDKEGEADYVNVPVSFVDVITEYDTDVTYFLTVQESRGIDDVFVGGPITFTAARIRPFNK